MEASCKNPDKLNGMMSLPKSDWQQIRTAYSSGLGLRELARNMGIPVGTVLSRAKREGWTRQIESAKALAVRSSPALANVPDAVSNILETQSRETRASLGRSAQRLARQSETADLHQAGDVLHVAKVAQTVFGWQSQENKPCISLSSVQIENGYVVIRSGEG